MCLGLGGGVGEVRKNVLRCGRKSEGGEERCG